MKKKKTKRGPGRPKGSFVNVDKKEATKPVRVPLSKIEAVKKLIAS